MIFPGFFDLGWGLAGVLRERLPDGPGRRAPCEFPRQGVESVLFQDGDGRLCADWRINGRAVTRHHEKMEATWRVAMEEVGTGPTTFADGLVAPSVD